jgi:hypothetical protein
VKQASSASHLGNLLRAPAVAGFIMFGLGLCSVLIEAQPALAQLPPVNMGKFVHQPGDNQYSTSTQGERHGGGGGYQVVNPSAQQMQGPSGWQPVHKNKPDISLEPIVCDEPVPHAGFPPIPDALELPGIRGGGSFSSAGSYGGSYGGGGGGAPNMAPPPPSKHQGYDTYTPGAFAKGSTTGKGAQMYQKPTEQYASGDGAARPSAGGGGHSMAQNQLNHLGKEPTLSDKATTDAAPEAPQAVSINQSTTQDLSLPDDQNPNGTKKKSKNQAGRMLQRTANRIGSRMYGMMNSMPITMPAMK